MTDPLGEKKGNSGNGILVYNFDGGNSPGVRF